MAEVNLKMLAKQLNLAASTVSRALRDSYEISKETKEKVFALARELNYQPNPYASSLRKHKSKTIAVVIPEIANNFFSLAINGIEAIAQEKNYHVLIYLTHEDYNREISITKHLQSGRVDGILMSVASETSNIDHLIELKNKGLPIVFFDRICESIDTPKVTTDDYESGFNATQHLINQGCSRVAYLSASRHLSITNKRMHGYLDALKKNRIKLDPVLIIDCCNDNGVNESLIRKMLKKKNRPDGVFASVEKLAITSYEVCNALELKIPGDLKIISFSNLQTASLLQPSLSTITQPAFDIGKRAAAVLFNALEKNRNNFLNETIVLPARLEIRNSTAL